MAGTVTITERKVKKATDQGRKVDVVIIDWTADAANGSVPETDIPQLYGFLLKAITNPGAVAPTANYDIELLDAEDSTIDALGALLNNRHTANTEIAFGIAKNSTDIGPLPPYLCGDYKFKLSGNIVNSATGRLILFLCDNL